MKKGEGEMIADTQTEISAPRRAGQRKGGNAFGVIAGLGPNESSWFPGERVTRSSVPVEERQLSDDPRLAGRPLVKSDPVVTRDVTLTAVLRDQ
jgi:hypothetical protein